MPRVTEVIDYLKEPELVKWMLRTSEKKRKQIEDDSLRVGSRVDLLVQQDLRDGGYLLPEDDSEVMSCMTAWEKFKKSRPDIVEAIQLEEMQRELSMRMPDGEVVFGHPDLPILQKDRWGILDIKSSKNIWPKHFTQDAVYTEMKRVMDGMSLPRFIGILRLDKASELPFYQEITDESYIQYEVSVFNAYYLAFNHNRNNRETIRMIFEDLKA